MDGAWLGDDGCVWGWEFFLCDRHGYQRLAHLEYLPLPGGDQASHEPWRMAVACLHHWGLPLPCGFVRRVGEAPVARIRQMIDRRLNTPQTSSAGRLFDAVASLTGLCDLSTRQAEAPVLLEQAISGKDGGVTPYPFSPGGEIVSLRPTFEAILQDIKDEVPAGIISARFHTTLAHLLTTKARLLMQQTGATKVVVSGGCFQNKYLTTSLQNLIPRNLYIPSRIPCNDSGIAVGQLYVELETF
jgi:hydrogenase maturation protein HypF